MNQSRWLPLLRGALALALVGCVGCGAAADSRGAVAVPTGSGPGDVPSSAPPQLKMESEDGAAGMQTSTDGSAESARVSVTLEADSDAQEIGRKVSSGSFPDGTSMRMEEFRIRSAAVSLEGQANEATVTLLTADQPDRAPTFETMTSGYKRIGTDIKSETIFDGDIMWQTVYVPPIDMYIGIHRVDTMSTVQVNQMGTTAKEFRETLQRIAIDAEEVR